MRTIILVSFAALFLMGCSKNGAKAHLVDGGSIASPSENRTPMDINFPELPPAESH